MRRLVEDEQNAAREWAQQQRRAVRRWRVGGRLRNVIGKEMIRSSIEGAVGRRRMILHVSYRKPCVQIERQLSHGDRLADRLARQPLHKPRAALFVQCLDLHRVKTQAQGEGRARVGAVLVAHVHVRDRQLHVVQHTSEQAWRERAVVSLGSEGALELLQQLTRELGTTRA